MDDQMIDSMAGDGILGRRLAAYAELRLSPELATSSRLRARVLAVAHRQASLVRADAGLSVLPRAAGPTPASRSGSRTAPENPLARTPSRRRWRRVAGMVLVASLGSSMVAGAALAARPGGPLYEGRLWAETLTLPADPSARALAELDRLRERLREIGDASRSGDAVGATAALAAYEAIVAEASASTILAGDEVAAAALETGVGRNVEVLQALIGRVPPNASDAIARALDAAIARSADAIDRIDRSRSGSPKPPAGGSDGGAGGSAADPTPRATKAPTDKSTKAPVEAATPEPRTDRATPQPPRPPAPTPERTPKPKPNQAKPQNSPPSTGGGNAGNDHD